MPSKKKKGTRVSKRRAPKKKNFSALFDAQGRFTIMGRTEFSTAAKRIAVNQNAADGLIEDRRHILHYDEVLKPNIERVMSKLYKLYNGDTGKVVNQITKVLKAKGVKRIPKKPEKVLERMVTEINSATENLIPDRADTNKAIEVVRGYVRKCMKELATGQFGEDCRKSNSARMAEYKKLARKILVITNDGGDITAERNRIHGEILEFVDGCTGPAQLWMVLQDVINSVTFDFSPNITREATEKALAWQKQMRLNEDASPEQQLDDLMGIIDEEL